MKKFILFAILLFIGTGIFAQTTYKVNDRVNIEWKGAWYTGRILDVKNDQYLVTYDGYSADWNEYVGINRLKPIGNSLPTKDGVRDVSAILENDTASLISFNSAETINDLQVGADGKYIYCASAYGNVKILNAKDLSLVKEIKTGTDPCQSISISHDGKYLAVGSNKLSIYTSPDGMNFTEYFTSDAYVSISKVRFSPVVNELTVSGSPKEDYKNTQVDVWNVEEKKLKFNLIKSTNSLYAFSDVAYSENGTKIALGISNGNHGIEVYDATTGKLATKIKTAMDVVACSFSPDGNSIATGGTDKSVTLWNLATKTATWKSTWSIQEDGYVYGLAFSADGKTIAACGKGSGKTIKMYDTANGKLKSEIGNNNPGGNCICYSPDQNFVFVALTTYGDIAKVPVVQRMRVPK